MSSTRFPLKTDALQLGPNATSPSIYRTLDNNLVFFDQSVGEITLKDIVPSPETSPKKLLASLSSISNTLSSINLPESSGQDNQFFSFLSQGQSLQALDKPYNHILGVLNASLPSLSISDSLYSIIDNVSFIQKDKDTLVSISSSNDTPTRNVIFRNCSFSVFSSNARFVSSNKTNLFFQNCSFSGPGSVYSINFKEFALSGSSGAGAGAGLSLDLRHNPAFFKGGSVSLDAPFSSLYASHCSVSSSFNFLPDNIPSISLDNSSLSFLSTSPLSLTSGNLSVSTNKSFFLPHKGYSGTCTSSGNLLLNVSLPNPLPNNNYIVLFEYSPSLSLAHQTQPLLSQGSSSNSITLSSSSPVFVSNKTPSSFTFNFPQGSQNTNISFSWSLLPL